MSDTHIVWTQCGLARRAETLAGGAPMRILQLAIGDGGGSAEDPTSDQTDVRGPIYRATVTRCEPHPATAHATIVAAFVPDDVGGWTARQIGAIDERGNLVLVARYPDTLKPAPGSGYARAWEIELTVIETDGGLIEPRAIAVAPHRHPPCDIDDVAPDLIDIFEAALR